MTIRRDMAILNNQCLTTDYDVGLTALTLIPQCFEWMRDHGYPVDDVENLHAGVSVKEGENEGYLVARIETLSKPTEEADVVEDTFEFWACSCPDFHFRQFPDLDDESITTVGECCHVEKVKRKNRMATEADDGQETLV